MNVIRDKHLAIIIPAMNESRTIAGVIQRIQEKFDCVIIVVDDASQDDTANIAKRYGAVVLPHTINLGAWRATQTGIRYALKKGMHRVITCDADGQHPVDALVRLVEQAPSDNDCTVGACTSRGSIGRHVAWRVFKRISGVDVSDLTSGLRLYSRPAMRVLASYQATMFEYQDVGVLLMLKKLRMKCSEIEVVMERREDGISRIFNSWFAVLKYLLYTLILSVTKMGPQEVGKYHKQLTAGTKNE
ncbi:glycosyl transferase family 2 [Alteromonas sp. KUL42]|uniref:glycosyltransferase family 2 protein n=1 Tax=Alteromonas sp. KUL42 TaxID=2480797 RepID=UPI000B1B5B3D|nr:glycosyltransferase family 2 protein [Alteromonas sp. KUL42]TAP30839.1 glycosyltransferase family 2 protein [Alteromonas sp. KUL42]GEA09541.1 glycosyl transferase family 2 [Alteromonas sp. KUL42]